MFDYIQGIHKLKQCLPDDEQQTYHTLEARLLDNLQKADLYGETPTNTAEKSAIINQLNKLALRYGVESFNDMCREQPVKHGQEVAFAGVNETLVELQSPRNVSPLPAKTKIELLAPVVPTAYCKNLDVDDFPLFRVTIDATDRRCADTTLHIYSWIEGYTDREVRNVSLLGGETKQVTLFPLFMHDAVKQLNEVRQVTLHVQIKQIRPVQDEHYETMRIRLLAYNAALLALEMKDKTIVDLSCYLAAWVTPNDPKVQAFLDRVVHYHDKHELEGYPDLDICAEPLAFVQEQVRAIYEALKHDAQMKYVDASLVIGNPNEQIVQRVKLPAETLVSGGNANCLDGTVLFASLLEAIGLQPLIMLEKGHAYLGWKVFVRGEREHHGFLETTLIDSADFATAQQRGLGRYRSASENHLFEHAILDMRGYARRIDITECHKNGIHPLT